MQSRTGCNYTDVYSDMNAIVLFGMLAFAPLSGWLTDVYAKQQGWFILVCSVLELLALAGMLVVVLFMKDYNPWIILVLQASRAVVGSVQSLYFKLPLVPCAHVTVQVLKSFVEGQLNSSIWKVAKMRASYRSGVPYAFRGRISLLFRRLPLSLVVILRLCVHDLRCHRRDRMCMLDGCASNLVYAIVSPCRLLRYFAGFTRRRARSVDCLAPSASA